MKYKMLNNLCVPDSTPDDFQEQDLKKWIKKQKILNSVSRKIVRERRERERFPDPEMAGDEYLVHLGYKF